MDLNGSMNLLVFQPFSLIFHDVLDLLLLLVFVVLLVLLIFKETKRQATISRPIVTKSIENQRNQLREERPGAEEGKGGLPG